MAQPSARQPVLLTALAAGCANVALFALLAALLVGGRAPVELFVAALLSGALAVSLGVAAAASWRTYFKRARAAREAAEDPHESAPRP